MPDEEAPLAFEYAYFGIPDYGFGIPQLDYETLDDDAPEFEFSVKVMASREQKEIRVLFAVKLVLDREEERVEFGHITTDSRFVIDQYESMVVNDEKVDIPDPLLAALLRLSISSTRGAFAARAVGTPAGDYVLPVIDAAKALEHVTDEPAEPLDDEGNGEVAQ